MTSVSVNNDDWREVLREQGRSLTWLAKRTGVAQVTVFSYSQGVRRPSTVWLEKAAVALGLDPDAFTAAPEEAAS